MTTIHIICTRPGMVSTGGEWNLIHTRNKILKNYYGIDIQMTMILSSEQITYRPIHFETAGYPIDIIKCSDRRFSITKAVIKYFQDATTEESKIILFSGRDFAMFPTKSFKKFKGLLLIDIHGEIAEMYEQTNKTRYLWDRLREKVFRYFEKKLLAESNGALVVSQYSENYIKRCNPNANVLKVPCASNTEYSFENYLLNREKWRYEFGFNKNDIVVVYSGSDHSYQCVNEHIDFMAECIKKNSNTKALILSNKVDLIKSKYVNNRTIPLEKFVFASLKSDEVTDALCAADIGLLLRKQSLTNLAAFPNKFDEYLASGLKVITSIALPDTASIIKKHPIIGFLADYDKANHLIDTIFERFYENHPLTLAVFNEIQNIRKSYSMKITLSDLIPLLK